MRKATRLTRPLWFSPPAGDLQSAEKELRREIGAMPESAATGEWQGFCAELAASIAQREVSQFLQWPVILETMNVPWPDYLDAEFRYLREHPEWLRLKTALQESVVGGNLPYWRYPWTSGNSVHHCYHVQKYLDRYRTKLAGFTLIFEFGGGYGNLCRIVRQTGYAGEYAIADLPPFLALQRYYLAATGSVATLLAANDASAWLASSDLREALFVATWSLSESPLAAREAMAKFLPRFGGHLIAFQKTFADIDNVAYFNDLAATLKPTHQTALVEIEHLPHDFYFFALRNNAP
jgi:hypothetical protein